MRELGPLFDKNYKVLDAGWQPAPSTTYAKQKLSFPTKEMKEEGYIYVWLSYDDDSNNYVYFDDFKVTHTKTNILQYNEYYPFGLQASTSWTRENNKNSFLYNEGSELNATSGWYETFFRGYDATLGRFMQVDPLAHASMSSTPYNYAYNDPVFYNDPNGDYVQPTLRSEKPVTEDLTAVMIRGGMSGFDNVINQTFHGSAIPDHPYSYGAAMHMIGQNTHGGLWDSQSGTLYLWGSNTEAYNAGLEYKNSYNSVTHRRRMEKVWHWGKGKRVWRSIPLVGIQQTQTGPGFFSVETNLHNHNGNPDYKGIFIDASYYPSTSDQAKYTEYNWLFRVRMNGSEWIVKTDPNNFVNPGPFYYGDNQTDTAHFGKNSLYLPSDYPEMKFEADLYLYGIKDGQYTHIGYVTYGFTYSNGVVQEIKPVMSYVPQK